MLVHAHSFAIHRGIAEHVHVELDTRGGLPAFSVIGLAGGAARDARERIHAALLNSGFGFPRKRVTVNLAPAAARGGGPEFDLALACCVLAAQEHIDAASPRADRRVRRARPGRRPAALRVGDAAAAQAADRAGLAGLIVARDDLRDARGASRLPVAGLAQPARGRRAARWAPRRGRPPAREGPAAGAAAGGTHARPTRSTPAERAPAAASVRPAPPVSRLESRAWSRRGAPIASSAAVQAAVVAPSADRLPLLRCLR